MISTNNAELARKLIKTEKKPVIIRAHDDLFNRKILEYGGFDILLSIESSRPFKKRNIDSGLNHVLAKIASKRKVSIGIDMQELRALPLQEKKERISRIIQNIRICRKAKTKICLLNYQDRKTALAFLISLGASTQQANEAISF